MNNDKTTYYSFKKLKPINTYQKNMHTDELLEIMEQYNKTIHRTMNMKQIDVKPDKCRAYFRKIKHLGIGHFVKSALFEKNFFW